MARASGYIVAGIVLLIVIAAAADISTRTGTCMWCHTREASFARWMETRLKVKKKGFSHELIACAACHIRGAAENTIMSRLRGLLHTVTYLVPQIDPRAPRVSGLFKRTRIPSENCQYCHLGAIKRKVVMMKDLPQGLKKIGLAMDHHKHVLTRDDTCAQCHERYKDRKRGIADKDVNYAEVNHLACDACHSSASHVYRTDRILPLSTAEYRAARDAAWNTLSKNPRWMVAIPTEQTCRRCHNGRIHFKKVIFEANCRTGTNFKNCVKCHPRMTRQYFEKYRQQRQQITSKTGNGRMLRPTGDEFTGVRTVPAATEAGARRTMPSSGNEAMHRAPFRSPIGTEG